MFVRNDPPPQISDEVREALLKVQTSTLGHMRDWGFPRGLSPLVRPLKFVGPAFTVRLPHLDSTALHVAVDDLRPGDVLVVDQSGDSRSCFGGMVAFTAKTRGAAGAVISGSVNDVDEIAALAFPVFSSGVSARTTRISGIEGAINVSVSVGGVTVEPGDIVLGDSDGLAVIKPEEALALARLLGEKEAREPGTRDRIRSGGRLSSISGASKFFEAMPEPRDKFGVKI